MATTSNCELGLSPVENSNDVRHILTSSWSDDTGGRQPCSGTKVVYSKLSVIVLKWNKYLLQTFSRASIAVAARYIRNSLNGLLENIASIRGWLHGPLGDCTAQKTG